MEKQLLPKHMELARQLLATLTVAPMDVLLAAGVGPVLYEVEGRWQE